MNKHFAPGVIERHRRQIGTPAKRRELVRWLQLAAVAMALTGGTGLVAGLVSGWIFGSTP